MKLIITVAVLYFLVSCYPQPAVKTGHEGKPLPSFDLALLDSTRKLNTNTILNGQTTVFFYFTPSCQYCRAQTQEIIDDIKSFTKIQLYLIANAPTPLLHKYSEEYKLNKYSNITVVRDINNAFLKYFDIQIVPFTAVYGKNKKLIQAIAGKTSPNDIKDIAIN